MAEDNQGSPKGETKMTTREKLEKAVLNGIITQEEMEEALKEAEEKEEE